MGESIQTRKKNNKTHLKHLFTRQALCLWIHFGCRLEEGEAQQYFSSRIFSSFRFLLSHSVAYIFFASHLFHTVLINSHSFHLIYSIFLSHSRIFILHPSCLNVSYWRKVLQKRITLVGKNGWRYFTQLNGEFRSSLGAFKSKSASHLLTQHPIW